MTIDQAKIVANVYRVFVEKEDAKWTEFDDQMSALSYLTDLQVTIEAEVILKKHSVGQARCNTVHSKEECLVPLILEATGFILEDFQNTKRLAKKARYVLEYYLSLSYTGGIEVDY